jgi:hypothetical protein
MNEVMPIAVIYYYPDLFQSIMGNRLKQFEVNEMFEKRLPGYLVLAIPSGMSEDGSCEQVRLEVFHPKDFTDIQFEELKKKVLEPYTKDIDNDRKN